MTVLDVNAQVSNVDNWNRETLYRSSLRSAALNHVRNLCKVSHCVVTVGYQPGLQPTLDGCVCSSCGCAVKISWARL